MMLWNDKTHLFTEAADPAVVKAEEEHGLHRLRTSNAFDGLEVARAAERQARRSLWLTIVGLVVFALTVASLFRFVDGLAAWLWHWGRQR